MKICVCIVTALCIAGYSASAHAAPPTQKAVAADSTAAHKRPAGKAKAAPPIRTIDAINIEGEIAVPQVLFITSRDNRRYRDGLGRNFRLGTLDVARDLATPKRLCVAGQSGSKSESLKEE
ncbi:MAG: hypothetical protein L0Z51_11745 [Candidatus Latescibacteria bacterium]|nr:hypothetical protein [Candidatus Latescibacterota bacterium]